MKPKCCRCKFWERGWSRKRPSDDDGFCRRFPPHAERRGNKAASCPPLTNGGFDWCGEFMPNAGLDRQKEAK